MPTSAVRTWSHLLKKSLMKNFIFPAVIETKDFDRGSSFVVALTVLGISSRHRASEFRLTVLGLLGRWRKTTLRRTFCLSTPLWRKKSTPDFQ